MRMLRCKMLIILIKNIYSYEIDKENDYLEITMAVGTEKGGKRYKANIFNFKDTFVKMHSETLIILNLTSSSSLTIKYLLTYQEDSDTKTKYGKIPRNITNGLTKSSSPNKKRSSLSSKMTTISNISANEYSTNNIKLESLNEESVKESNFNKSLARFSQLNTTSNLPNIKDNFKVNLTNEKNIKSNEDCFFNEQKAAIKNNENRLIDNQNSNNLIVPNNNKKEDDSNKINNNSSNINNIEGPKFLIIDDYVDNNSSTGSRKASRISNDSSQLDSSFNKQKSALSDNNAGVFVYTPKESSNVKDNAKFKSLLNFFEGKPHENHTSSLNNNNKNIITKHKISIDKEEQNNLPKRFSNTATIQKGVSTIKSKNSQNNIIANFTKNFICLDSQIINPIKNDTSSKNRCADNFEAFCEGFYISGLLKLHNKIIPESDDFQAPCKHFECSMLPAYKPEILTRYPLKDTKRLELSSLVKF